VLLSVVVAALVLPRVARVPGRILGRATSWTAGRAPRRLRRAQESCRC
jgi:hypothetical protein